MRRREKSKGEGQSKKRDAKRNQECQRKADKEKRPEAAITQEESTLSYEYRARKRGSKQKRMEEQEVTALYSLTLMGTKTDTRCLGQNSATVSH